MEHRRDEEKAAGRYRLPICSSAIPHAHDDTDPSRLLLRVSTHTGKECPERAGRNP